MTNGLCKECKNCRKQKTCFDERYGDQKDSCRDYEPMSDKEKLQEYSNRLARNAWNISISLDNKTYHKVKAWIDNVKEIAEALEDIGKGR